MGVAHPYRNKFVSIHYLVSFNGKYSLDTTLNRADSFILVSLGYKFDLTS